MTKRRAVVGGAIVAAVILIGLAASWALGQPGGDPQDASGRPLMKLIRGQIARAIALHEKLNLSSEQRTELRGIMAAHKAELKPLAAEVVDHKRALRAAVMAEQPDEATIRREAAALGETMGDIAVVMAGVAGEARTVLTPEQLQLIEQSAAERDAAVDGWLAQLNG